MYKFECKDLGYHDEMKITGKSIEEVTRKVIDHAWREHDMRAQTSKEAEEFIEMVKSKIQEVR